MNNEVWEELLGQLYAEFNNTTEVMAVIGYREDVVSEGVNVVEMVEYYTSHDESEVLGNFRSIVREMAKYVILRKDKSRFVIVHNHPGGTDEPSESDIKMTQRFQLACRMLGATMMGSYIYVGSDNIRLIGSKEDEFNTVQIRMSNQYPSNGNVSLPRRMAQSTYQESNQELETGTTYGERLNEAVLDGVFNHIEPYGVIELDDNNNILGIYEVDKLQPNIENRQEVLNERYHLGIAQLLRRDKPRLVLYDKREGVERDELRLAEDAKSFIKALGLIGYPVNFYING